MSVAGPPVSLLQAATEFGCAAQLTTVRSAAGLPPAGGLLELAGKAYFSPFVDLNLLACGAFGLDRIAYFKFNFFNPADSGFTGQDGPLSQPIWAVRASAAAIQNAARGIERGVAMRWWASGNSRATLTVTQLPTLANGGILLITYNDHQAGSGDSQQELYVSMP